MSTEDKREHTEHNEQKRHDLHSDGDKQQDPIREPGTLDPGSLTVGSTLTNYQNTDKNAKGPPFSVFSTRQKWVIIALSAFAGFFSPLTANIYFPAIQTIADAFHTSVELINVTITVYMVLQGISPMLWGTLSDRFGRRPLFLICLALLSTSCVGMALVPTDAYWLLVLLRCFQAAGSASIIALVMCRQLLVSRMTSPYASSYFDPRSYLEIWVLSLTQNFEGSGAIADIAEPSERGGFLGVFNLGPLVGPCIGPSIGGVLTGSLGWRSIFWFLTISSSIYLVILFLFFPETLRIMVGNGSIAPPKWNRPLIPIFTTQWAPDGATRPPPKKVINPLRQFTHPSVVLVLVFNGTVYSVFYGVTATLCSLFADAYPFLTESEIGICFLAIGTGCSLGSYTNGKLLDIDFRRIQQKLDKRAAVDIINKKDDCKPVEGEVGKLKENFPIEYARLRVVPIYLAVFVASTVGYGWSVQRRLHISCPLILQFVIGWALISVMNMSQTLLMDLYPKQGSSITAANYFARCMMGATLVSIIDFLLQALGPGWTFTLLSGVCVLMLPMNWAVIRFGPRWRERRAM